MTPRALAAHVLARIEKERAFAAAVLDAELERHVAFDGRDKALTTELVYGTLRTHRWLEERLKSFAARGLDRLDPLTRAHLFVGAYQIYFLSGVPAFAAVNEAVSAVRQSRNPRMAGFVNAVLRRAAGESKEVSREERERRLVDSTPAWFRQALTDSIGEDDAKALLATGSEVPWSSIRVEDPSAREAWLARFRAAGVEAELGAVSPLAIRVRGAGKLTALPGYEDGAWTVQEEGSQVVALAVGAKAGMRILDACAGRGNKTGILARAAGPDHVDAADAYPKKLSQLDKELARVGLRVHQSHAVDWSVGTAEVTGPYEAILVDAPCSGTGTLRRRPDLDLRREESDIPRLAALQLAITDRVTDLLAPGGLLVYAVCSILRTEGEEVVRALLTRRPELHPCALAFAPKGARASDGTSMRLLPHVHGTDGYFVAAFRRA